MEAKSGERLERSVKDMAAWLRRQREVLEPIHELAEVQALEAELRTNGNSERAQMLYVAVASRWVGEHHPDAIEQRLVLKVGDPGKVAP